MSTKALFTLVFAGWMTLLAYSNREATLVVRILMAALMVLTVIALGMVYSLEC